MAYMAYIAMACMAMAYIVTAYIAVACIVMALNLSRIACATDEPPPAASRPLPQARRHRKHQGLQRIVHHADSRNADTDVRGRGR